MTPAASPRRWSLHAGLLALWFAVSFGMVFYARDIYVQMAGAPAGFWFAAQGAVLIFISLIVIFAWVENRREGPEPGFDYAGFAVYKRRLHKRFALYVVGFLVFLIALAMAERWGLPKAWVAGVFLAFTLILYAVIGVYGRTADANEYYVAGRRIPAVYNGMATAADWMSAA